MAHTCHEHGCHRSFLSGAALADHAAAVHFDDIRGLVADAIRGSWQGYVVDLAPTYAVFDSPTATGWGYFKVDYQVSDANEVTLGEPVQVIRLTTYETKPGGGQPKPCDEEGDAPAGLDMEDD